MCLAHPFAPEAQGARVPEPYAQPTVTYKWHRVITITTNGTTGANDGAFDICLSPSMNVGCANIQGTLGGVTAAPYTNGPATFKPYSYDANLSSVMRSYRVVGMGVKLKSNTTFNNTTGRVYMARIPAATDYPAVAVPVGTSQGVVAQMWNMPVDAAGITSSIYGLPKAMQYTLSELHQESGTEIINHPISPSALDFLDSNITTGESQTGLAVNYQAGFTSGRGWQQIVICGEGLPGNAQILTLEVVFHLEGTPFIGTGGAANLLPSGTVAAVGQAQSLNAIHSHISQLPMATKIRDKAAQEIEARARGVLQSFGRRVVKTAREKAASSRGNLAADLLGVALL